MLEWSWDARHRSRSPRPFSTAQFIQYLKSISHPTLLVFGQTSQYLQIPDLDVRIQALSNHTVCTLPNVGHHTHIRGAQSFCVNTSLRTYRSPVMSVHTLSELLELFANPQQARKTQKTQ